MKNANYDAEVIRSDVSNEIKVSSRDLAVSDFYLFDSGYQVSIVSVTEACTKSIRKLEIPKFRKFRNSGCMSGGCQSADFGFSTSPRSLSQNNQAVSSLPCNRCNVIRLFVFAKLFCPTFEFALQSPRFPKKLQAFYAFSKSSHIVNIR